MKKLTRKRPLLNNKNNQSWNQDSKEAQFPSQQSKFAKKWTENYQPSFRLSMMQLKEQVFSSTKVFHKTKNQSETMPRLRSLLMTWFGSGPNKFSTVTTNCLMESIPMTLSKVLWVYVICWLHFRLWPNLPKESRKFLFSMTKLLVFTSWKCSFMDL